MWNFNMTCNCLDPAFREDVSVIAEGIYEAWDKAKAEVARKYDVNIEDVTITATHREDLGLTLYNKTKGLHNDKEIKRLIEAGADVNYRFAPDVFDYSPLHMAAYYADIKSVELLVEAGCDINPVSIDGKTPLDLAVERHNRLNVVQCLTSHGAKRGAELTVDDVIKEATSRSVATNTGKENNFEYVKE